MFHDDCDYDADKLDNDRRLCIVDRLLAEVRESCGSVEDALELSRAIQITRRVRVRQAQASRTASIA